MNHINQRNALEKQITDYVRVIKIGTRTQVIKLSKEIAKLSARITTIEEMSYADQKQELDFHFETKQSKMNFKTIETPTDMSKKKRNAPENCRPIFGEAAESRRKALELASQHVDVKPVKYLLKN
jgi:hypothetical protein